jgi:hypothetical protein
VDVRLNHGRVGADRRGVDQVAANRILAQQFVDRLPRLGRRKSWRNALSAIRTTTSRNDSPSMLWTSSARKMFSDV